MVTTRRRAAQDAAGDGDVANSSAAAAPNGGGVRPANGAAAHANGSAGAAAAHSPARPPGFFSMLVTLARLKMAVFSAVTYSTAFTLGLRLARERSDAAVPFSLSAFFSGWLFMFLCQMSAHLLGEYYDLASDSLNQGGPFTGGSKVLVKGGSDPGVALVGGWLSTLAAVLVMVTLIPHDLFLFTIPMLLIAHQYSAPPLKLNHRGLGELAASKAMNILTPLFAMRMAYPGLRSPTAAAATAMADGMARLLIVPPFLNKVAMLLMLNIADRLPDWAAGKETLAVKLGDALSVRLHLALMGLSMLSVLFCLDTGHFSFVPFPPKTGAPVLAAIAVLAGILPGLGISLDSASYLPDPSHHAATTKWRPEVVRTVKQAPYPVLAILFTMLAEELAFRGPSMLLSPDLHFRLLPLYVFAYNILSAPRPPPAKPQEFAWTPPTEPILIAGAGPSGLGLYNALTALGFSCRLFDRRSRADLNTGADVGLWPGAIRVLAAYGVGGGGWWDRETWPVATVRMANARGRVFKAVDMDAVNPPDAGAPGGGRFRLIGRQPLMDAMVEMVGEDNIEFGREVLRYEADEGGVTVEVSRPDGSVETVRGFMLVGADGIGSTVRKQLRGKAERPRYAGEVCHRGVLDMSSVPKSLAGLLETPQGEMRLIHGEGWRGSYGLMAPKLGFWWFKHPLAGEPARPTAEEAAKWPEPFNQLLAGTPDGGYWVEPVLDRGDSWAWGGEKGRVICIGDAAHPVTPNMAQGCTTSITDSLLLAVLLRRLLPVLPPPLSLLEAQYQLHLLRAPHVGAVARTSYMQARIGQWTGLAAKFREWAMSKAPLEKGLRGNREERTASWVDEWLGYAEEWDRKTGA
ncbi:hypothetical protein DFJ74DRAFT_714437 [Hyaloraphidium curvatum]|nr:hypothetical protein DFJ74DRAFT_714437 [Hyaloraphidium curvatum]